MKEVDESFEQIELDLSHEFHEIAVLGESYLHLLKYLQDHLGFKAIMLLCDEFGQDVDQDSKSLGIRFQQQLSKQTFTKGLAWKFQLSYQIPLQYDYYSRINGFYEFKTPLAKGRKSMLQKSKNRALQLLLGEDRNHRHDHLQHYCSDMNLGEFSCDEDNFGKDMMRVDRRLSVFGEQQVDEIKAKKGISTDFFLSLVQFLYYSDNGSDEKQKPFLCIWSLGQFHYRPNHINFLSIITGLIFQVSADAFAELNSSNSFFPLKMIICYIENECQAVGGSLKRPFLNKINDAGCKLQGRRSWSCYNIEIAEDERSVVLFDSIYMFVCQQFIEAIFDLQVGELINAFFCLAECCQILKRS